MLIINFILGLLPIIWLVIALCGLKWPGYKAALGALIIAAVEALTYFGFSMSDTLTSILEGFAFAMWPIVIVIIFLSVFVSETKLSFLHRGGKQ